MKLSDIECIKMGLHVLHEIVNFTLKYKLYMGDSHSRICEPTQPYL